MSIRIGTTMHMYGVSYFNAIDNIPTQGLVPILISQPFQPSQFFLVTMFLHQGCFVDSLHRICIVEEIQVVLIVSL